MTQVEAATYTHPTRGESWHTGQTCPRCGGPVATNGKVSWCTICGQSAIPCEVYTRVVGYYAPVSKWNVGKRQEFSERVTYTVPELVTSFARDQLL